MEKLIKDVVEILNDFSKQELGNRLSTYAWGAFANTIVGTIRNHKPESKPIKREVKEDVKK